MEAVNRKAGGNNHELAKEIASEHLATGSYSCIDDQYILTKKMHGFALCLPDCC